MQHNDDYSVDMAIKMALDENEESGWETLGEDDDQTNDSEWEDYEQEEARAALQIYHNAIKMQQEADKMREASADEYSEATPVAAHTDEVGVKTTRHAGFCFGVIALFLGAVAAIAITTELTSYSIFSTKTSQEQEITGSLQGLHTVDDDSKGYENLVNIGAEVPSNAIPLVWVLPGAGDILERILSGCLDLVAAGGAGGDPRQSPSPNEDLSVFQIDEFAYVTVDTYSQEGIDRAIQKNLVGSGMANVVYSPFVKDVSKIFTKDAPGILVSMFHDPVQRVASVYNFVANNPAYGNKTLMEFIESSGGDNNDDWMTRTLCGDFVGAVDEGCLEIAKETLEKKCVIGLTSHFDASLKRIIKEIGVSTDDVTNYARCVRRHKSDALESWWAPLVEEESPEYKALAARNQNDIALFEFAKEIFRKQHNLQV